MERAEAKAILKQEIARFREKSYADLIALVEQSDGFDVTGPSGKVYVLDVSAVWDGNHSGNVRLLLAIDDGSWRTTFSPLTDDFIMTADGLFIGE